MTGGTRGIGRAIAEAAAAAGAGVSVLARKPAELEETAAALAAIGAPVLHDRRFGRQRRTRRNRGGQTIERSAAATRS